MIRLSNILLITLVSLTSKITAQDTLANRVELEQTVYSKTDFRKLEPAVIQKINDNKVHNSSILNGIALLYIVDFANINSETSARTSLAFLYKTPEVISFYYTKVNRVFITTDVSLNSTALKDIILKNNQTANFIDQTLILKK